MSEKEWPSRFGTLGEKVFGEDDPFNHSSSNHRHVIVDEMPPTRHPIDGRYYTSKARFREVTKAHGYEEVGTAYENGYDPSHVLKDLEAKNNQKLKERFREYLNRGR